MAKNLLVYYTRSGNTEKVAQKLNSQFGANVDKLIYGQKKNIGFLGACFEAVCKKTEEITGDTHSPSQFDHIVILTPIWASSLATPVRSYINKFRGSIKSYSVIATSDGGSIDGVLKECKDFLGKDPVSSQLISSKDIKAGNFTVGKIVK